MAAAVGFAAGAVPIALTLPSVWGATRLMVGSAELRGGAWAEKASAWSAMLDGSYFHRMMLAGGSFERMGSVDGAASGPFPWILVASAALLTFRVARGATRGGVDRPAAFALLAAAALPPAQAATRSVAAVEGLALRAKPDLADEFEAYYGTGSSQQYLLQF